jgi:hypothetical protein
MTTKFQVGDYVMLTSIPDWLVHDLPESEKRELVSCIGLRAKIEKIDQHGYCWIGFGRTTEVDDGAQYTGHSFCVPESCLNKP